MTRPLAEPTVVEVARAIESSARFCAKCGTQTHDATGRLLVSIKSVRGVQVACAECDSPRKVPATIEEIEREQYEIASDARLDGWLDEGRRGPMPRAPGGRR